LIRKVSWYKNFFLKLLLFVLKNIIKKLYIFYWYNFIYFIFKGGNSKFWFKIYFLASQIFLDFSCPQTFRVLWVFLF
jgi:hypothetical protein